MGEQALFPIHSFAVHSLAFHCSALGASVRLDQYQTVMTPRWWLSEWEMLTRSSGGSVLANCAASAHNSSQDVNIPPRKTLKRTIRRGAASRGRDVVEGEESMFEAMTTWLRHWNRPGVRSRTRKQTEAQQQSGEHPKAKPPAPDFPEVPDLRMLRTVQHPDSVTGVIAR
jgi:hypothetical protein